MLVSTTESIPGIKIVKLLGEVHARNNPFALGLAPDMSENAKKYLIKEAEKLGANAIVGFRTERQQYRSGVSRKTRGKIRFVYYSYGTAVIAEESKDSTETTITTPRSTMVSGQPNFCPQCGASLQENAKFCMQCGNKIM